MSEEKQIAAARLSNIALICAVMALVSTLALPVVMPLSMAPVAIVLAIISKGRERRLPGKGVAAVTIGTAAIVINTLMLLSTIYVFYRVYTDPEFYSYVNGVMEQYYGMGLDAFLNQYEGILP